MAPQHPSVILSGGKPQKKDLTSIARRRARKTKSKVGQIRRPRRYKPGSKYNPINSLTIANSSQLVH